MSEQGLAASITTVQLYATAFSAATAGMVANLGGFSDPGGAEGASSAALFLFGVFLVAPALGLVSVRRLAGRGNTGAHRLVIPPPRISAGTFASDGPRSSPRSESSMQNSPFVRPARLP